MTSRIQRREVTGTPLPGLHPVLARVYSGRAVTAAQLDLGLRHLAGPDRLTGTAAAAELLHEALEADARILLVGDFDTDGATSCALGVLALRRLGATSVDYLVPNRFEFGYGLTPEIVGVAAARQPDLLITVDNGIASNEGVAVARELGISVLITDHHLPGAELPTADVIVNPNQTGDSFPSKNLAGVGVIFYVISALRARLRQAGWFSGDRRPEPNLAELLDLVALGTVADLVPLDYPNRILVNQGLARIRAGQCRPGITALLELAGRSSAQLTARDLGFSVAPRLNAAGRLDDMSHGIECLLADDPAQARVLAAKLDELNTTRRDIEADMQQQALAVVARLGPDQLPNGLCLYDEHWHQGLVGLIASRVKDHSNRPVIAFARDDQGQLKGSARSVEGLHMRDTLEAIATRHPELLHRFGGHAMAAGLILAADALDGFREAFDQEVRLRLGAAARRHVVLSDGELQEEDIGLELAELLQQAGPWGQTFPEPTFDNAFEVLEQKQVGDGHLKLRLRLAGGTRAFDGISFRHRDRYREDPCRNRFVRMVYRLEVNEFQGLRGPQLNCEHMEPA